MSSVRTRTLAAILALGIVAGVGWYLLRAEQIAQPSTPREETSAISPAAPAPTASPAHRAEQAAPLAAGPIVKCREQEFSFSLSVKSIVVCAGATRVLQTGSIRNYAVEGSADQSTWSLQVNAIGERVLEVILEGANYRFECAEEKCYGVTIGKHDSQGVRQIVLRAATLRQVGGVAITEGASPRVLVTATLRTLPESQVAGVACTSQGIGIVGSDGTNVTFCAMGGAGYEMLDDGGKRYEFASLDMGTLYVSFDASEVLRKVELQGGALVCEGAECGGVTLASPNEKGERSFTFSNTTLRAPPTADGSSNRFVTLNGALVLPGDL